MVALSPFLRKRCSEALTDSHLVDSKDDLEDIFTIPELFPHRFAIPDADNSEARVRKTITMLLNLNSEEVGPQLFLVFLRNVIYLSGFPKTNVWYRKLSECCALVEIEHVLRFMGKENEYGMEDIAALVEHFHKPPHIDDNTYERMLHQLPPGIARNARERLPGFDIPAMVRLFIACLSTPDGVGQLAWRLYQPDNETEEEWRELDRLVRNLYKVDVTLARLRQLQSLLERMKLPVNVLSDAYRASAPESVDIPISDEKTLLPAMLTELGKLRQDKDNTLPILMFAARLAQYVGKQDQQDIQSWIEARVRELGKNIPQYMSALDARRRDPAPAPAPVAYLLIVVDPGPVLVEPPEERTFEIRAWLLDDQNQPVGEPYPSSEPVSLENIPGCISEICRKYKGYVFKEALTIEVFLSKEDLLCCAIDHWLVDIGLNVKFGTIRKLVVRSLDRAQNIAMHESWREKWNVFLSFTRGGRFEAGSNNPKMKGPFWMCEEQDYKNREALFALLNGYNIVCLILGFVPPSPEDTHIRTAISVAGVPIVLWPREKMRNLANAFNGFKAQWREFFQSPRELLNLPDWVFTQRVNAQQAGDDHHGHHLTLLWDDPNRLPPDIAGRRFALPN
ncbi:MAG TPA: hypothetical protein VKY19_03010 [Ktedonosporobacter sp.]|jgi:hypothetical protein|nr:hypothetical protein [Ktedonosporobacter sp.]